MPNQYFDAMAAKLIMAGFKDIQMIDHERNMLAAYDQDGREILIVVHRTNELMRWMPPPAGIVYHDGSIFA